MLYIPAAPDPQGLVKVRDSGLRAVNPNDDREVDLPLGMVFSTPFTRGWIGAGDPGYLFGGVYRGKFYDLGQLDQLFSDIGATDRFSFMNFIGAPRVAAMWPGAATATGPGYATALATRNWNGPGLPTAFNRLAAGAFFAVDTIMRVEIWFDITSPAPSAITVGVGLADPISGIVQTTAVSVVAAPGAHKLELAYTMRDNGDVVLLSQTLDGAVTVVNAVLVTWPVTTDPPYVQIFDITFVDAPSFLTLTGVVHASAIHVPQ